MRWQVIHDDHICAVALARLEALIGKKLAPDSALYRELELLAVLIEDYERRTVPEPQVDPVEAILFRLDQMGMTRRDLIPFLGTESRVSEILNRKRPLNLRMIRRLHEGLGIPAQSLIGELK